MYHEEMTAEANRKWESGETMYTHLNWPVLRTRVAAVDARSFRHLSEVRLNSQKAVRPQQTASSLPITN